MQNANVRPWSPSGGTVTEVVRRRHQPRRTRNGAPRGVSPHYSCGPMDNVYGPGSSTESDVLPSMSPARKGGCAEGATSSLQLRCKRIESFAPARSVSAYGVLRKLMLTVTGRASVSAHAQCGCSHLPGKPQGLCGGSAAATRSNVPSSDVTVAPGGIPAPSGAGPWSETL